jgi:hypothetical protein
MVSLVSFRSGPRAAVLEEGVGERRADVGRGEHDEDVGLHDLDERLEEREDDAHGEGERGEHLQRDRVRGEEHVVAAEDEQHQQQVAGEHVAEQPQRERHGAQQDVRQELDRGEDDPHPPRHVRRPRRHLQVAAQPVVADAHDVVDQPHQRRERVRHAGMGERRELEQRDDPEQVVHEHEREQRGEERDVLEELRPDHVPGDRVPDDPVERLAEELPLARHQLRAAHRHPEEHIDDHGGEHELHDRLGDAAEDGRQVERVDPGRVEARRRTSGDGGRHGHPALLPVPPDRGPADRIVTIMT